MSTTSIAVLQPDGIMARPSLKDDYVRRRAAEIILDEVCSWQGDVGESEKRGIAEDLAAVASHYKDGYEMAKDLERKGWCCNSRLVEILDGWWVGQAIEELTAQWVLCLNIQPLFSVGTVVEIGREGERGPIVNIDLKRAAYGVRLPGMAENAWRVVNFEDAKEVLA